MSDLSKLISRLKERSHEVCVSLGDGKAEDWEAYQRMVGERRGLEYALAQIIEVLRSQEDEQ